MMNQVGGHLGTLFTEVTASKASAKPQMKPEVSEFPDEVSMDEMRKVLGIAMPHLGLSAEEKDALEMIVQEQDQTKYKDLLLIIGGLALASRDLGKVYGEYQDAQERLIESTPGIIEKTVGHKVRPPLGGEQIQYYIYHTTVVVNEVTGMHLVIPTHKDIQITGRTNIVNAAFLRFLDSTRKADHSIDAEKLESKLERYRDNLPELFNSPCQVTTDIGGDAVEVEDILKKFDDNLPMEAILWFGSRRTGRKFYNTFYRHDAFDDYEFIEEQVKQGLGAENRDESTASVMEIDLNQGVVFLQEILNHSGLTGESNKLYKLLQKLFDPPRYDEDKVKAAAHQTMNIHDFYALERLWVEPFEAATLSDIYYDIVRLSECVTDSYELFKQVLQIQNKLREEMSSPEYLAELFLDQVKSGKRLQIDDLTHQQWQTVANGVVLVVNEAAIATERLRNEFLPKQSESEQDKV